MQTEIASINTMQSNVTRTKAAQQFTPLAQEMRPTVDTAAAAHYLNRQPQTLRIWALTGHPITPRRINGRLAWSTDSIRKLLGVAP